MAVVSQAEIRLGDSQITDLDGPIDSSASDARPMVPKAISLGRRGLGNKSSPVTSVARSRQGHSILRNCNAKAQVWVLPASWERIEDRGSQITFSALGQNAPVEAKEAWDPTNEKKNRLAQAVATDLPHLAVRSEALPASISPRAASTNHLRVQELARILGIDVHQIIFVGDRMDPDGNDYPAAVVRVRAVRVTGPADTVMLCDDIIESLRGQAG